MTRKLRLAAWLVIAGTIALAAASGSAAAHDHMECANSYDPDTPHPSETCVPESSTPGGGEAFTEDTQSGAEEEVPQADYSDCEHLGERMHETHNPRTALGIAAHGGAVYQYGQCIQDAQREAGIGE